MQNFCVVETGIPLPPKALQSITEAHETFLRLLGNVHCQREPLFPSPQAAKVRPELPLDFGVKFGSTNPYPSVSSGGQIQQNSTRETHPWTNFFFFFSHKY